MSRSAESYEVQAQKAAEEAYERLEIEAFGDPEDEDDQGGGCICATCVVREVLQAAWPFLLEAAREEARTGVQIHDHYVGGEHTPDALAMDITKIDPALATVHRLHPKAP